MKNALACLLLLSACAPAADKGPEDAPLTDGKADGFFSPTQMGELDFDGMNLAALTDDEQFLAYDFSLSGDAELSIATDGDEEVDTVLYLYQRKENGSFGRYVAKNDDTDADDSLFSLIEHSAGAGEYRLIVKGYHISERGSFQVEASCTGAGCHDDLSCPAEIEEWLIECAQEVEEENDLMFHEGVEMCLHTPFAGLGDEPIEVWLDLCTFGGNPAWCDFGVEVFMDDLVPACEAKVLGQD